MMIAMTVKELQSEQQCFSPISISKKFKFNKTRGWLVGRETSTRDNVSPKVVLYICLSCHPPALWY